MHSGRVVLAVGVRAEVCGDEAVLLDSLLELRDAVGERVRLRHLRQHCRSEEPARAVYHLLLDCVVRQLAPPGQQVARHPTHHRERTRPDDLDIDVAFVHVRHVILVGCRERFVAEPAAGAHRRPQGALSYVTGGQTAQDPVPRSGRRGNVTMDIKDGGAFEHRSLLLVCWLCVSHAPRAAVRERSGKGTGRHRPGWTLARSLALSTAGRRARPTPRPLWAGRSRSSP